MIGRADYTAAETLVAESGVFTPEDGRRLRNIGADTILVGEAVPW